MYMQSTYCADVRQSGAGGAVVCHCGALEEPGTMPSCLSLRTSRCTARLSVQGYTVGARGIMTATAACPVCASPASCLPEHVHVANRPYHRHVRHASRGQYSPLRRFLML